MNNHVPLKETCLKLKELGFPQKSYFSYYTSNCKDEVFIFTKLEHEDRIHKDKMPFICSAPLATEILEWLPEHIIQDGKVGFFRHIIRKDHENNSKWYAITYIYNDIPYNNGWHQYKNFAEALAQMLIYLVENKIVSFERGVKDE